jgi:AcrR family transcriptional regulator
MTAPRDCITPAAGGEDSVRERILHAAMSAFMERGYAGTSTLEIATRARVSKRELYTQFGDKQAMLAACVLERARRMRQPLALPRARDIPGLGSILRAFGKAVLREVTRPGASALYRLAIVEAERAPEVALELNAAGRNANRAALEALLAQAKASGLVAGDPAAMTARFLSLLWDDLHLQLLLRATQPPQPAEITRRARDAAELLLALHAVPGKRRASSNKAGKTSSRK